MHNTRIVRLQMSTDRLPAEGSQTSETPEISETGRDVIHRTNKVSPEPEVRDRAHLLNDMDEGGVSREGTGIIEMQTRRPQIALGESLYFFKGFEEGPK